jgi:hypothetical protein
VPLVLNVSVAECKTRWNHLRDSYRKSIKKWKISGHQAKGRKQWKYEEQMIFLLPFFTEQKQRSNLSDLAEGVSDTNSIKEEPGHLGPSEDTTLPPTTLLSANTSLQEICNSSPVSYHSDTSEITLHHCNNSTGHQQKLPPMAQVGLLKNYLETKRNVSDHLRKFFDAMEATVRTFSPHLQVEIKSKISALVTEYELRNLE